MGTLIVTVAIMCYILGILVGKNWNEFTKED